MSKNIIQHKFEDFYFNVSEKKYVYVNYSDDEASKDDNKIKNESATNSINYIEINIDFRSILTQEQIDYIDSLDRSFYENLALEENIDLSRFNKTNHLKNEFYEYYHDKDEETLSSNTRIYLNKSNSLDNINMLESFQEKGFVLNLNKKYTEKLKSYSEDSIYYNENDFLSSEFVDADYTNKSYEYFLDDPSFNLNGDHIKVNSSHDTVSYSGSICIGFLVEKFYEKNRLTSRFLLNNNVFERDPASTSLNYNFSLKDTHVQYGKTYKYIIYPVFVSSITDKVNYHLIKEYLFCYSPYAFKVTCVEKENPFPPHRLKFIYEKLNNNLDISWTIPDSPTNDTAGYFVFKRHDLVNPFELVGVVNFSKKNHVFNPKDDLNIDLNVNIDYDIHVNSYKFKDYNPNKITVFALATYDAHGNISNYSEQIAVLYNSINKKLKIDLISKSGAPLDTPNLLIPRNTSYFGYQESIEDIVPIIKNKRKISVYCTPEFVNITDVDNQKIKLLKENYIFNIFKLENQKSFQDTIKIKNFNSN
jgi:hypothetical protein